MFHWLDVLAISAVYKQTGASALDSNLRFDDFEITSKHEPCILFSCGSLYLIHSSSLESIGTNESLVTDNVGVFNFYMTKRTIINSCFY